MQTCDFQVVEEELAQAISTLVRHYLKLRVMSQEDDVLMSTI